jgi:hypothetical protein
MEVSIEMSFDFMLAESDEMTHERRIPETPLDYQVVVVRSHNSVG